MSDPKISAVVLNWNGGEILKECVESLRKSEFPIHEIIVVDNASTDNSPQMIRNLFQDVIVMANPENLGAPEGRNEGLRRALQEDITYVYTLDNDLVMEGRTIAELASLMEKDTSIGCAGSIIYHYDQKDKIFNAGHYVNWTQNLVRSRGLNQRDTGQLEECAMVDYVGTGAMLTRKDVFQKIGLLDVNFIGYGYEDSDFGLRVNRAGYKVVCYTRSKVWHRPFSGVGKYSFKKKYLESRNAIGFLRKHGSPRHWAKFSFYAIAGLCYAAVREGLRGNMKGVIGKARGLYDGLLGREDFARILLRR